MTRPWELLRSKEKQGISLPLGKTYQRPTLERIIIKQKIKKLKRTDASSKTGCYHTSVKPGLTQTMLLPINFFPPNFRWKGENVATTEVTEILGLVDFIQEVNVYGVQVPGIMSACLISNAVTKTVRTCSIDVSFFNIHNIYFACYIFTVLSQLNTSRIPMWYR